MNAYICFLMVCICFSMVRIYFMKHSKSGTFYNLTYSTLELISFLLITSNEVIPGRPKVNIMQIFYRSYCKNFCFIHVRKKWLRKLLLRKHQPENASAVFSSVLKAQMAITTDTVVNLNCEDRCVHYFMLNAVCKIL